MRAPWQLERLEDRDVPTAGVLREVWAGLAGDNLSALMSASTFPSAPTTGSDLTTMAVTGSSTNVGERWRALVTAPQTGIYRFFVSGAGETRLSVSTDSSAANARIVAAVPSGSGTAAQEWTKFASQESGAVWLVAGQTYYLELLHKHGAGTDNAAFGWQLPNSSLERPMPNTRLTPVRPTVQLWTTDDAANRFGNTASFSVTRDDDFGRPLDVPLTTAGSAVNGTDYTALPATITIPAGQKQATLVLSATSLTAPARAATLALASSDRFNLGLPGTRTATATIAANSGLPAGTTMLPANWYSVASTNGGGTYASYTNVSVSGQPFTQAKQAAVTTIPPQVWQAQSQVRLNAAISSGDRILVTLWLRGDPAQVQSVVSVGVQQASGSYQLIEQETYALTPGWTRIDLRMQSAVSLAPNDTQVAINFGYQTQTVQWGGLSVTNYGSSVALDQLPTTESTYGGRDPLAAWRTQAASQIDAHRRGDLTVHVVDAAGLAVPGALVHVDLQRDAFNFGSAVVGSKLVSAGVSSDAAYRAKVLELFNSSVLENDLKWGFWQSNRTRSINAVNWLRSHGLTVRGHNLQWPSWGYTPSSTGASSGTYNGVSWASNASLPASQAEYNAHVTADGATAAKAWLAQRLLSHIADEAGAIAGQPYVWDVVNEPYDNHDLMDVLGQNTILDWYRQAALSDPNALLAMNDYGQVEDYGMNSSHRAGTYYWINYLMNNGTLNGTGPRFDVIGFQSHFGSGLTSMDMVKQILDGFGGFGKSMEVTEFDVNTKDEQLQADYTRDYLTLIYSYPQMKSFLMWGFWESAHWRPDAAMYRADWSAKPNAQVWIDLTQGQWATDATGTTQGDGRYAVRGTRGSYSITATYAGQTVIATATLDATGTVTLTLPFQLPAVQSVRIDDGSGQRSTVRSLTVSFTQPVTLAADAFAVQNAVGQTIAFTLTIAPGSGPTVATLQFAGSLAEGRYTLTVRAGAASTSAGATNSPDNVTAFHRMAADLDGNGSVDAQDVTLFLNSYGTSLGHSGYRIGCDLNSSGAVDAQDVTLFLNNYGRTLP